jgi:hypothetical protein
LQTPLDDDYFAGTNQEGSESFRSESKSTSDFYVANRFEHMDEQYGAQINQLHNVRGFQKHFSDVETHPNL